MFFDLKARYPPYIVPQKAFKGKFDKTGSLVKKITFPT